MAMTQEQHAMGKVAEEAIEFALILAQTLLKCQQFGGQEVMPGQDLTNFQRCHKELDDLFACVTVLNERYGFGYEPNEAGMVRKIEKMAKYTNYSVGLGLVEGNHEGPLVHPMAEK